MKLLLRCLSALGVIAAVVLGSALPAQAHVGDETVIYLDVFEDSIEGEVQHPVTILNDEFGFDLDAEPDDDAVAETFDEMAAYQEQHLSLGPVDSDPWTYEMTGSEPLETENGYYGAYTFEVDTGDETTPREFALSYDGLLDRIDDHKIFVVIRTDFGTGTFINEGNSLVILDSGDSDVVVDLDDRSILKGLIGTIDLGILHILDGTDHILFVLVLLLPAVLVFTGEKWEPSTDFASSFWRVLKIATSFTIAHSITLTLGGLGILELPSQLVETIIALSIIAAALHNLRPVFANREWVVAFGFGLFHGLGFAGLLSDLGIGKDQRIWSLLGFNLGVEIGQIGIILALFPILYLLRRTSAYAWVLRVGSILLALIAFVWALERIFDTDLGINSLIGPFIARPRVYGLVIVGILAAAAWFMYERSRDRLLPVADS
jgi:hypothetical protein